MKIQEKHIEYAIKLVGAIQEVFNEDSDNYIGTEDFENDDNVTAFMYALACMVPKHVYEKITGDETQDVLGFNHIANRLAFQFGKPKEDNNE